MRADGGQLIGGSIEVHGNAVGAVLVSGQGNKVTIVYGADVHRGPVSGIAADFTQEIGPNPYRSLDAYDETSSDYFFGRESLISRLFEKLCELVSPSEDNRARLLAIMGPSGSGKSSVARAGLLPALTKTNATWLHDAQVAVFNPTDRPIDALAGALARLATGDPAPLAKQGEFAKEIRLRASRGDSDSVSCFSELTHTSNTPLVLIVDQFEEVYTLCRPLNATDLGQIEEKKIERQIFVDTLLHAASQRGGRVCVVLTLRSDFFGALAEHPKFSKAVAESNEIIPAMDREDLSRAISEPAKKAGTSIDRATVHRMLDEAEAGAGNTVLPLVSYALFQLWERMREGVEPSDALVELGGVGGAIAKRADQVLKRVKSDRGRALVRTAFLATVQVSDGVRDTRRRAWLDEVIFEGMNLIDARQLLTPFIDERLLAMGADQSGRIWLELPHEAIIRHWSTLRDWITSLRDDLRFRARLHSALEAWNNARRPKGSLWRRPDLDLLKRYAERNRNELTSLESAFLRASEWQLSRAKATIGGALAVMTILAIVNGILWSESRQQASALRLRLQQAQLSESQRLAQISEALLLAGNAGSSALVALEALPHDLNRPERPLEPSALKALEAALISNREIGIVGIADAEIKCSRLTDKNNISIVAVSAEPDGTEIWRRVDATPDRPEFVATHVLWHGLRGQTSSNRDCSWILIQDTNDLTANLISVLDPAKRHNITRLPIIVGAFDIDHTEQHLAVGDQKGLIVVLSLSDDKRQPLVGHGRDIAQLAFSPDATRLASVSYDGTGAIWELDGSSKRIVLNTGSEHAISTAWSNDGHTVYVGTYDGQTIAYDAEDGAEVKNDRRPLDMVQQEVISLGTSSAGLVASGSLGGIVKVWFNQLIPGLAPISGIGNIVQLSFSEQTNILSVSTRTNVWVFDFSDKRNNIIEEAHLIARSYRGRTIPDARALVTEACQRLKRDLSPREREKYLQETAQGDTRDGLAPVLGTPKICAARTDMLTAATTQSSEGGE